MAALKRGQASDEVRREWVQDLHQQAEDRGLFGEVAVRYEHGRPVHADIRESRKPPRDEG